MMLDRASTERLKIVLGKAVLDGLAPVGPTENMQKYPSLLAAVTLLCHEVESIQNDRGPVPAAVTRSLVDAFTSPNPVDAKALMAEVQAAADCDLSETAARIHDYLVEIAAQLALIQKSGALAMERRRAL